MSLDDRTQGACGRDLMALLWEADPRPSPGAGKRRVGSPTRPQAAATARTARMRRRGLPAVISCQITRESPRSAVCRAVRNWLQPRMDRPVRRPPTPFPLFCSADLFRAKMMARKRHGNDQRAEP
ncbi:hypothetical protein VTH06DRAFT_4065 [Thermothelomyces fergusii]